MKNTFPAPPHARSDRPERALQRLSAPPSLSAPRGLSAPPRLNPRRRLKDAYASLSGTQRLECRNPLPRIRPLEIRPGDLIADWYRVERVSRRHVSGALSVDAIHEGFDLPIALRLLGSHIADEYSAGLMQRRAQAVAQLESKHVARILDAGILADGTMYVARESFPGDSLIQRARAAGGLDLDEVVTVFLQICEVVQEAHARGIVLCELRPEDLAVTVGTQGLPEAMIVDLGACMVSRGVNVNGSCSREPFSPWSAPEFMRQDRRLGFSADIWSLGCLLFELLCGRRPFGGSGPQLMLAIARAQSPRPSMHRTNPCAEPVPCVLDDMVRWALNKDPAARPRSVHMLVRSLGNLAKPAGREILQQIACMAAQPVAASYILDSRSDRDPSSVFGGPLDEERSASSAHASMHEHDPEAEKSFQITDEETTPDESGVHERTSPVTRSARRRGLTVEQPQTFSGDMPSEYPTGQTLIYSATGS